MIKVGLGQTEGIDTSKAVRSVIAKCERQLQGYQPQAGIVFAGTNFDHREMLAEINRNFPQIELIGCTTAGELSSNYGFSDESIILKVFYSNDIIIKAGVGRVLSENYRKRLEEVKDFNATMHRTIIREVEEAREKIQRKEADLRKSEEKYRRIVETAGEGFILMDQNLVIVDVNDTYCRLIGFSRDEILGKTTPDLATEEIRQFFLTNRNELLASDYREFEGAVVAKGGRQVPILVHGNTLRDDRGGIIGSMAFVTDMTEHKKALTLAAEVQKSLLPQGKPHIQGLDIAGKNVSCDEIGGDYFDFLWRRENPNSPFSVIVGDITGHGVDSALLMTSARAFLRMRASQPGTMSEIVTAMNSHLTRDVLESGRFMTFSEYNSAKCACRR